MYLFFYILNDLSHISPEDEEGDNDLHHPDLCHLIRMGVVLVTIDHSIDQDRDVTFILISDVDISHAL